jgi:hypothetical protein
MGKITVLPAIQSIDAGALRYTPDHLGCSGGTLVHSPVASVDDEH